MTSDTKTESLFRAIDMPVNPGARMPQRTSEWLRKRNNRRQVALIANECLEEGYKSGRGLRREVLKRYRKRVGFNPMMIISVISLIVSVVRLVIQWRGNRGTVIALIFTLLLCLPACASPQVTVDGNEYVPLARAERMLSDAIDGHNGRIALLERQALKSTVYSSMMPGENYVERVEQALATAQKLNVKHINIGEPGYQTIDRPIKLAFPGEPRNHRQLLNGVTIEGDYVRIWCSPDFPENQPMFDLPSPTNFRLQNIMLLGRVWDDEAKKVGRYVPGVVGVYHRAAWEYNVNGSTCNIFERIYVSYCRNAAWIGSPSGPDMTDMLWSNCAFLNCETPFVVQGPNVTSYKFDQMHIVSMPEKMQCGWKLLHSSPCEFSKGEYLDPWENPVPVDRYDNFHWRRRLWDGKHNGNHSDFDISKARTIGGSPWPVITNSDVSFGENYRGPQKFYAIESHGASGRVDDLRVEGHTAGVIHMKYMEGSGRHKHKGRGSFAINKASNISATTPPIVVEDYTPALIVSNSEFPGFEGKLPEQEESDKRSVTYSGRVFTGSEVYKNGVGVTDGQ